MISCIALELYFLEVSILMYSFINFGQRSCPVLAGHNLWHLFASYVTLFIHTILYYAYYCITIPGRTANTNTTIFLLWQIPRARGFCQSLFFSSSSNHVLFENDFNGTFSFSSIMEYGPCSNIRLKIPLCGIIIVILFHYEECTRLQDYWAECMFTTVLLKMILWIKSDVTCYEKLSFSTIK